MLRKAANDNCNLGSFSNRTDNFHLALRKELLKKLILILLCIATVAQAQLIDLTPGGFNPDEGLPPAYYELINQTFFDEAAHGWFNLPWGDEYLNGWVSMFGALDGGTYFQTNLFQLRNTPSANVWWNFGRSDYGITMIDVWGRKPDGTTREHIYKVRRGQAGVMHPDMVTLDGMTLIKSIAFYGTNHRGRTGPVMLLRYFAR